MAVHANHVSFLLLGFILLGGEFSPPVMARPPADAPSKPGQDAIQPINMDYNPNQPIKIKENDSQVLQGRDFTIFGSSFFENNYGDSYFNGNRINIDDERGVIARAYNRVKPLQVHIDSSNKVYFGRKLVCDDARKLTNHLTYQKSSDGTLWYTNLSVGGPMTKPEMQEFQKRWKAYEELKEAERKEKEEEKRREQKQREKELKDKDKERKKERKEREAERRRHEEERENERRERDEEREREWVLRDEERERELKQKEAERKQRDEERREREKGRKRARGRVSSPKGKRSNAGVNMTNPFRDDFMVGFDPLGGKK